MLILMDVEDTHPFFHFFVRRDMLPQNVNELNEPLLSNQRRFVFMRVLSTTELETYS